MQPQRPYAASCSQNLGGPLYYFGRNLLMCEWIFRLGQLPSNDHLESSHKVGENTHPFSYNLGARAKIR